MAQPIPGELPAGRPPGVSVSPNMEASKDQGMTENLS